MIAFPSDAFAVRITNETAPYAWVVRSYDPSNGPQESAHATAHVADDLADRAEYVDDADELRDAVHDIADSQVDIYYTDLTAWLASHAFNADLVDEACAEYGEDGTTYERIACGQYLALERLAYAILELCEARAEELEEGTLDAADEAAFAAK